METDESKTPAAEKPAVETPATEASVAENPAAEAPVAEKTKKPLWRRILKWTLWSLVGIVLFLVVALLTLPLWINPVGTSVANAVVPWLTDTAFNLERINLNPYTGKLLISGVKLANPEGYAEKDAFTLGSLSVDVESSTLLSSTIHVRDITIDAPFASYVFDAAGSNNIERIIATVNEKLGPKKEKKEEPSETKVVIDKVTIKNVRVVVNTGVFELESLTLADFGKADAPAKVEIAGAKLVNPKGFPVPDAFSLKSLSIGLETADLSKRPMVFHDIVVRETYVGLVYNDAGDSNFDVMFKPFMGDEKEEEKKDVAADEKKDEKKDEDDTPHVTIDKLDIDDTKVQYRKVTIPVPIPTLTDIGKDSDDGASMKDVAEQVLAKAQEKMGNLGDLAGALGSHATNLLGNAAGMVGAGATNLLGGATSLVGGAADVISGGTSNVLGGAKGLLGNVLPGGDEKKDEKKAGGEPGAAAKAVEGVKNIGGSAVEGAKSLGEGVKNLGGGALKSLGIGK